MPVINRYQWLVATALVTLASCTLPPFVEPTRQIVAPTPAPSAMPTLHPAKTYTIDSAASTVHVLVYRGGRMARLGHNHVISSCNISGSLWLGASLQDSGFVITVPVNTLIVDDNDTRSAEGADFPLNLTEDAKQGTKANMLRDALLDGANFPEITIQSLSVLGDSAAPQIVAAMRIKDKIRQITVPITLQYDAGNLRVKGAFEIKQTDFGITPLSVALGALLVQDTVTIKFELLARTDLPAS